MKKNIQINLFGTLYNIDDDAYQLLENYLDSMKSYFSRQDGGEEIADDIEHRVAELLWQHKQLGMEAVSIETVKEIIAQIGNPQDIDDSVDSDASYTEYEETSDKNADTTNSRANKAAFADDVKKNVTRRRFYRNPNDKMIGGVCSGLAQYVGRGDVTLWRLSFAVLPFILEWISSYFSVLGNLLHLGSFNFWLLPSGFWIIPAIYIVLCIIVPEARTAEDRLRMKGAEVTPENINAQVISDTKSEDTTQPKKPSSPSSSGGGCLKALLISILLICAMPFIFVVVVILLVLIFIFASMFCSLPFINAIQSDMDIPNTFFADNSWLVVTGSIAGLLAILTPLYLLFRRIMGKQSGKHSTLVMLIIWLLMIAWAIFATVTCGTSLQKYISPAGYQADTQPADTTATQPFSPQQSMEELEDTAAIDLMSE